MIEVDGGINMGFEAHKISSGNYRARVTFFDEDGKQHSKSFTARTKKEAEAAASRFKFSNESKQKPENITIGEALDIYIDSHIGAFSPSTIASYRGIRSYAFADINNVRLGFLTQRMIQVSVNKHRDEHEFKTTKNALSLVRRVLKDYKLEDLCDDVVIRKGNAKEIQIPTEDELDRFLESIIDTRLYIYTMLGCYGGLRRGEIIALTWKDIDFKKNLINIDKTKVKNEDGEYEDKDTTKTPKSKRKIPIVDELLEPLRAKAKDVKVNDSDLVITDKPDAMKDAYERARIKYQFPYNFHSLRHYFTSYLLLMGIPIKDVSEILGHSTITTTQRVYAHTFPQTKEDAFIKLNEKLKQKKEEKKIQKEEEGV